MSQREAYKGSSRNIVLALDLGTTYSGVSYSILDPGGVPEIKGVTRFPALKELEGLSEKIPTIIYYGKDGTIKAIGAETISDNTRFTAQDEGWVKAEWFKMHLHPTQKKDFSQLPKIPEGKTLIDLFSDFYRYLYSCASAYIQEAHLNGQELWSSTQDTRQFVLSHPNGWQGAEQNILRKAAVLAGLITDDERGHSRLSFVTEGEASLLFVMHMDKDFPVDAIANGEGVAIVDAGGGTIDISAYGQKPNSPGEFQEIAATQCHMNGSVFVTSRAGDFIARNLTDSRYSESIDDIIDAFDSKSKLTFSNDFDPLFVQFGGRGDNEPDFNIRMGRLKLAGTQVAEFFKPSIDCIVNSIDQQVESAHAKIQYVALVGGFAASDWLYKQVVERLKSVDPSLKVFRPQKNKGKAVADGGVSFFIDHSVRTRVSTITYGTDCGFVFDEDNSEHKKREDEAYVDYQGRKRILGFDVILPKDTQVSEASEFRRSYSLTRRSMGTATAPTSSLMCYRGSKKDAKWMDVDQANYADLCTIKAQLPEKSVRHGVQANGREYYRVDFDIIVLFGGPEMKAMIAWKEHGEEQRGPASIVYNTEA